MKKKILIVGFGRIGKKLFKILPKNKYFISILRTKKNIKEKIKYKMFFSLKEARNYNQIMFLYVLLQIYITFI